MDDTQLGRPPRHYRPPSSRRAPSRGLSMACTCGHGSFDHEAQSGECGDRDCGCQAFTPWSADVTRNCATCGADVDLGFSDGVPQLLAAIAARQVAGDMAVLCEACSEQQEREEAAAERVAARAERISMRRAVSGMPRKWTAQRFATLDDLPARRRAVELAADWARGDLRGLVLWGPVGRGKTAIAAAAANSRLEHRSLRWLPVAELLLDLKMPFDSQEYARAVRALEAAGSDAALVLDDLDKLKPTEHAVQPLYVAINAWVEAELPLLVTLNRDLDALEQWMPDTFGAAIASRLSGYCAISQVGGDDRRLAGAGHALTGARSS